jgi:hypothetical protein
LPRKPSLAGSRVAPPVARATDAERQLVDAEPIVLEQETANERYAARPGCSWPQAAVWAASGVEAGASTPASPSFVVTADQDEGNRAGRRILEAAMP